MTPFDPISAIMAYLRARGSAPEDDIARVVEAREEEHYGEGSYEPTNTSQVLFRLVRSKRLRWRGQRGLTAPLTYSIREARR